MTKTELTLQSWLVLFCVVFCLPAGLILVALLAVFYVVFN